MNYTSRQRPQVIEVIGGDTGSVRVTPIRDGIKKSDLYDDVVALFNLWVSAGTKKDILRFESFPEFNDVEYRKIASLFANTVKLVVIDVEHFAITPGRVIDIYRNAIHVLNETDGAYTTGVCISARLCRTYIMWHAHRSTEFRFDASLWRVLRHILPALGEDVHGSRITIDVNDCGVTDSRDILEVVNEFLSWPLQDERHSMFRRITLAMSDKDLQLRLSEKMVQMMNLTDRLESFEIQYVHRAHQLVLTEMRVSIDGRREVNFMYPFNDIREHVLRLMEALPDNTTVSLTCLPDRIVPSDNELKQLSIMLKKIAVDKRGFRFRTFEGLGRLDPDSLNREISILILLSRVEVGSERARRLGQPRLPFELIHRLYGTLGDDTFLDKFGHQ